MSHIPIPPELLRQCYEHGGQTYPEEGCGVLSGPVGNEGALDGYHPVPNILNRMHAEDPERYPRTAARGYLMDPAELMGLEKQFAGQGRRMKVIFHTHVDVGAYFSQEDIDRALWAGQPIVPGVSYLVCGIKDHKPDGAILAVFDKASGTFLTHPVDPATSP